ncbi:zf-HC2 domain-containing protein [Candidatus Poribacteria bacterium]|nr:zf-HC2 domain-containing protein [Candidatus Poribacteria bacterium]
MNCLQAEENFSAHLEDALDYQMIQRFESHIAECTTCQREYARFSESVKASQQLPQIEPSPYFIPTLKQRLAEEQRGTLSYWQRLLHIFNMPKWAFSGIMVLLLITATVTFLYHDDFFNSEIPPSNKQISTQRPGLSSGSPSINNQFLPRASGTSDFPSAISTQPTQKHYTLKRVSYTTASTGGGL